MKNLHLPIPVFALFFLLLGSCASPKQVFYFQPAPANPKLANKVADTPPVYTASTGLSPADLPAKTAGVTEKEFSQLVISKKDLRKILKTQIRMYQDSARRKPGERQVTVKADTERMETLKKDMKDLKNSVRVQKSHDKVVVNYKEPQHSLSNNELILLAIAALLVLALLFSIPVLGGILAFVLALAVVALAAALVLGIIEIDRN